jgi:hypothetical protein
MQRTALRRVMVPSVAALVLIASCSSTSSSVGPGSVSPETTATSVAADTSVADTSTSGVDTMASTAPAPTPAECDGAAGIPVGADVGAAITGDIDGDALPDLVTEYAVDGVPHVHSQLATGGHSDAAVPIGFGDHVQISFEDIDFAGGSDPAQPVVVMALGPTKAGTAQYTFLTNTPAYCIQPWHDASGEMWVGRISSEGPYQGLRCEGAMGSRFYSVVESVPDGTGNLVVTTHEIDHNFTLIELRDLGEDMVVDDADSAARYGDIDNCRTDPLFHDRLPL